MFQDTFEPLLRDYPDAVSDRRKLAGLLNNFGRKDTTKY